MGYYTIRLDKEAQNLCTIIFPWGKYRYKRLPMGINCAPDIFQEKMSNLMTGPYVHRRPSGYYLGIVSRSPTACTNCTEKINADKSTFCAIEIEYLGFWITRQVVQPMTNKIEAIQNIARPATRRQLRRFIGMINF